MQSILNVFIGGFIFSSCVLAGLAGAIAPFLLFEAVHKLCKKIWKAASHEKSR